MKNPVVEQTWLDEDTALKAAARKGWGFESLLLRHLFYVRSVLFMPQAQSWGVNAHPHISRRKRLYYLALSSHRSYELFL